jgi:hypothetical protein
LRRLAHDVQLRERDGVGLAPSMRPSTHTGRPSTHTPHRFPLLEFKMNAPFVLHTHLNHPANEAVVPLLCAHAAALGAAATRLLRLLCARLFRASLYRHRDAAVRYRGAFGTVYKGRLPLAPHDVAIKLLDVPSSIHDRCVLPDLFAEVPPASCVSICLYLYPYIYIYIYI